MTVTAAAVTVAGGGGGYGGSGRLVEVGEEVEPRQQQDRTAIGQRSQCRHRQARVLEGGSEQLQVLLVAM